MTAPRVAGFLAGFAILISALPAAADAVAPPPPPITQADREARIATAQRNLREMPAMFDRCYERAPLRGGRDAVAVRFEIRANGRATRIRVTSNESRNTALARCLTNALAQFQFRPSRIERIAVTHQFARARPPVGS